MFNYGCKDFGTTVLKIKNASVMVVLISLKHNGLSGRWQIQSIFTQTNQYQVQIFVYA